MKRVGFGIITLSLAITILSASGTVGFGQSPNAKKDGETKSIGGKEHEANILGVTIGMDVSTALRSVFVTANRQPGQEKPDAKRLEGADNKDIRVVYKKVPQGELQILFADGKYVKEIVLIYANPLLLDDLRLPFTSSLGNSTGMVTTSTVVPTPADAERGELSTNTKVMDGSKEIDGFNAANLGNTDRRRGEALDGTRYDDRYTIGFVDSKKLQRLWWRDEKAAQGYKFRVQFVSEKTTAAGAKLVVRIAEKAIFMDSENEIIFLKNLNLDERRK